MSTITFSHQQPVTIDVARFKTFLSTMQRSVEKQMKALYRKSVFYHFFLLFSAPVV